MTMKSQFVPSRAGHRPILGRYLIHIVSLLILMTGLTGMTQASTKLKFWAVTGTIEDVDMYRRLAQDFTKKTGIEVEVTSLAWGNFKTKFFAAMAAGIPPDVGITNLGGPFDYGSVGGLYDLSGEFPAEGPDLVKQFDPKLMGALKIGEKVYGLPADLTTLILYYRKDIYDSLGWKPPQTWSELNNQIAKLEGQGYSFYFGFTNGAQWAISLYTAPYGMLNLHLDRDGKPDTDWDKPQYQKGVLQAMRLWNMHDLPGKDLGGRAIGMFAQDPGKNGVPLMADITQVATQIHVSHPEIDGKWSVAPWPKADEGEPFAVTGGTSYVLFRKSKHPKEAFQWIKYLNSKEVQEQIILDHLNRGENSNFYISPLQSIWAPENRAFFDRPEFSDSKELIEVVRQTVATMRTYPALYGSADQDRAESNLLDSVTTFTNETLTQKANGLGLSRAELIRSWGLGKNLAVRDQVESLIAEKLKKGYGEIADPARKSLLEEQTRYESKFGKIVRNLDEYERATSALTLAKWFVGLSVLAAVCTIASKSKVRQFWASYAFVGVPVILSLTFVYIPALVALYLSLTEYHPVLPVASASYRGAANYQEILASGDLFNSLKRTLIYTLATLPVGILLALLFAYLLSGKLRGSRLWRFFYFSPIVTSVVSISLIFSQLFLGSKQGWLNMALMNLGLAKDPVQFLSNEKTFLPCVIVLAIWHGLAFTILVFLAAFQQVPQELYEAAAVDGASPSRRFWNVALPGIRPQIFFITVLGVIGSFQAFETIYMLTNKSGDAVARFGPGDSGLTVVPLLYHYGFETFEMGKSAAMAYVLFGIILVLTTLQLKAYRRGESR